MTPARADFLSTLGFALDPFQVRALDALDEGRSVLVAAPTGSGKTVVAEYAVAKSLVEGGKAFYTTPLKALSNQKYGDLVRRHGPDRVGLLTGDNSINGDAPVVVMTTEVLRNMIYAGSPALTGLRCVVLDEVHYLQNPYRGAVWEEVIIHSPPPVKLVCLSATVSNAEEFADWISTVRGDTAAIIEERRPVALNQLYLVGDRRSERLHLLPTFVDGRPNPAAAALEGASQGRRPYGRPRSRLYAPWRSEVVDRLGEESMLPAIYFIFSRAACDDAVRQCLADGVRLTTPEERRQIRAIAEAKVESLSDDDLRVLGYGAWLTGLEAGLGAHHAGLVPPFKEAVEACFGAALVRVVFATETLSLGINMPARSVVIEKLTKFTGERHETLTAGEYTQLTGRAGRRGIDEVGNAVVLWNRFVPFSQVAGLASTRTYALTSSFRPTYNMTANLVRRYPPDQAHHLLNLSFAQYRADADVVHLEAQLERTAAALADARRAASCDRGDVEELRALDRAARRSVAGSDQPPPPESLRTEIQAALERIRPGDVLRSPRTVASGPVAVITTARRRGGDVRLGAVSLDTRKVLLRAADFHVPPRPLARIELPVPYDPSTTRFVRQTAAALRRLDLEDTAGPGGQPEETAGPGGQPEETAGATPIGKRGRSRRGNAAARGAGRDGSGGASSHPVASCPQLRSHLRAADRADRLERERERLERRIRGRSESLARQFDRVLGLLRRRGYVEGWSLTEAGDRLARIYHEADLLVAETLGAGLFDRLDPPSVAALASVFTFEARGPGPGPSSGFDPGGQPGREAGGERAPARERGPRSELQRRWRAVEELARRLAGDEAAAGLPPTRPLDPGFAQVARAWAAGDDLSRVIADEEVSGGDFVRNIKQLIDLLRQIEQVAPVPDTARAAARAADDLFRDIVAASSVLDAADTTPS